MRSLPFGRRKTTVGLDIGSGLVKLAVVDHGRAAPELSKVVIVPLAADAIVEGEVMDPALVTDAILEAFAVAGVKPKGIVTAVGGRDVIIKRIQIERVKEQQARELMRWEAEQHVPFDMESVELDFQILDPDGTGSDMSVLLVAAKRELIDAKMRLLTDAGLRPSVVDVDAFALHNCFEVNHPDAMTGIVALINVGHEVTNINVVDEGVPVLTRDLAIGTRRFAEDLQRVHGLGVDEAQTVLRGFDRTPELDAIVQERAEEIAVGVERATAFLAASRSGVKLHGVYTSGGGARVPGLVQALGARLRLSVQQANPFAMLHVRDGALDGLVTDEVAPLLMLPIGLALRLAA